MSKSVWLVTATHCQTNEVITEKIESPNKNDAISSMADKINKMKDRKACYEYFITADRIKGE